MLNSYRQKLIQKVTAMPHINFTVISHKYTHAHAHNVDSKLRFSNVHLKMHPTLIYGKEVPNNPPGGTTEVTVSF